MKSWCQTFILINLLSGLLSLVSSCGNRAGNSNTLSATSETPPSISRSKDENLVKLSVKETNELKIQTMQVNNSAIHYTIAVPGVVFPAPNHVSIISTPIDGRVTGIFTQEGQPVKKGQLMFSIESMEFGSMVSEYLQAVSEETFQSARLQRLEQLVEQTISSKNELERARSDYQRAKTTVIAALSKLKAIGVPEKEINAFKSAEIIDPTLKIHSPISGVMDQRTVEQGQAVNALQMLARVLDIEQVLIRGYVSPEDAQFIQSGDSVKVFRRQNEGLEMQATVTSVNPGLDESNRSVVVNILMDTKDHWPKPGENLHLSIASASTMEVISIPVEALTYEGNDPIVFVKVNESTFEKRKVDIRELREKYAIVQNGLSKDEWLATSQIFSLKALSRFDKIAEE